MVAIMKEVYGIFEKARTNTRSLINHCFVTYHFCNSVTFFNESRRVLCISLIFSMNLIVYCAFLLFCHHTESYQRNSSWNPCPHARSTFDGISVDSDGGKHLNCVCNEGYFGEKCALKVYFSGRREKQRSSTSKDHDIFPLKFLRVYRFPNGSTLVHWQHLMAASVKYYALHFRPDSQDASFTTSSWQPLVDIKPAQLFSSGQNLKTLSYLVHDLLNTSGYEINLGVFNNGTLLVSVSIFADPVDGELLKVEKLAEVWYSGSLTWSEWNTWGNCETNKGCGRGIKKRSSVLERERCISEKKEETRPCKLKSCPVDGGWSNWASWTQCSVSCGNGTKSRIRSCSNPVPKHRGKICFGIKIIKTSCTMKDHCPDTKIQIITKFQNLDFASVAIGAAAGFISCLIMMTCPRLLKSYKRTKKCAYKRIPPHPPLPPAFTKPVPKVKNDKSLCSAPKKTNWQNTSAKQTEMANNIFMTELLKAFQNFNVLENKRAQEAIRQDTQLN